MRLICFGTLTCVQARLGGSQKGSPKRGRTRVPVQHSADGFGENKSNEIQNSKYINVLGKYGCDMERKIEVGPGSTLAGTIFFIY